MFFFYFKDYEVTVTTADKFGAGTDANVFITVYGKKGTSKKMQLRDKSKNNFESGDTDKFQVRVDRDTGPLTKIRCIFYYTLRFYYLLIHIICTCLLIQ